jgi:putative transposase
MSRGPRLVLPGMPHHITQRGIHQTNIFVDPADRLFYSDLLFHASQQYRMFIHAYTWMTNHVHIIAVPESEDTLERVFRKAHSEYARKFNRKYELRGYLWQDRFFSCPLDEPHYWAAIRYVERNPIRAGMVRRAEDYRWSSARVHCGLASSKLLTELPALPLGLKKLVGMAGSAERQRMGRENSRMHTWGMALWRRRLCGSSGRKIWSSTESSETRSQTELRDGDRSRKFQRDRSPSLNSQFPCSE